MIPKFKVGQKVFFKSDVEQYGIITRIINDYNIQYEVNPANGHFHGEYIPHNAKSTILYESDCHDC